MLQSKIDQSRKALMLKEEAEKKRQLEEVRKERQHPLKVFLTSQPDLLSTPFDYEEAVKDKLNALHSTDNIEVRIGEIDSKLDYLRRQRESPLPSRPIEDGFDEGPLPKEGQELVRRWQNDRKEREERQRRRLERQQEKERLQLQEELEKKQQEELLKKKIRVANSEAKLHDMNQKRVMRAEMHRYQSKVVTELIRHPRTYYFFKASEEAIEKVRQKLKGKFESHKVKLDEQRSRLQEIENQWAAD
jgi:hypothetical protein